ncbi:hypothetical protein RHDC4_00213 [Rhodocyclaceae bacterium]|nr:hypothetical protein RHDC4_00213 [Rhodocyclaceae bacterium]
MPAATSKKTDKKPAAPKTTGKAAATKAKAPAAPKAKPAAKPATKKKADKPMATGRPGHPVGEEQRRNYIEVAAYYIAERRGFNGGNALEDWAAAEAEIDRLLAEGRLNP